MKSGWVLIIGMIILVLGVAMPQTQTTQSRTCTDGGYYGDVYVDGQCVDGQAEVPNTSRGPVIGFGFILSLVGGALALFEGNEDGMPSNTPPPQKK